MSSNFFCQLNYNSSGSQGWLVCCLIGPASPLAKSSCRDLGGRASPGMASDSFGSQGPSDSLNHCCLLSSLGPRVGSLQWTLGKAFYQEGWLASRLNGMLMMVECLYVNKTLALVLWIICLSSSRHHNSHIKTRYPGGHVLHLCPIHL